MAKRQYIGTDNLVRQNIVRIRESKGIRQQMLIARIQIRGVDIPQTALSAIEGQTRRVTDKELAAIADALGVPVGDLFCSEGPGLA